VERPHRDQAARDRRRRKVRLTVAHREAAEIFDVGRHRRLRDRVRIVDSATTQELFVAPQVAAVRGEGVDREAPFDRQPHLVLGEQRAEPIGHGQPSRPGYSPAR